MSGSEATSVLSRCAELAGVTAAHGRIDRFHLTPEHARANALVADWFSQAGMSTWQDAAGNVVGRLEGREPGLPALLLGSHLDTVPDAGAYDGPLGVLVATAVVARLRHQASDLPFAIEVYGFGDEEGSRFGTALLGSRAVAGSWDERFAELVDGDGRTLRQAFADFGLDVDRVDEAARDPDDVVAYLEAHIEQGPELEDAGLALGVVRSIAGARRFHLATLGEARHAGGTPFARRRDALVGASHAVLDIERIARADDVIATVGQLRAFPGGVNVIPGRVEFSLDLRAEHDRDRDTSWERIENAILARCTRLSLRFVSEEAHRAPAVACAPWLQDAVAAGIRATGQEKAPVLFSRAGHDAMVMAGLTDIGMLFVRCNDGISHHPDEDVLPADVDLAVEAFEAAIWAVAASLPAPERVPWS